MHHRGNALDSNSLGEMLVEIVHSGLEIFVGTDDRAFTASVSHNSGDADDAPCPVVQGCLAAQVSDKGSFAIGHEANLVPDYYVFVCDPAVFFTITMGEQRREKVGVTATCARPREFSGTPVSEC